LNIYVEKPLFPTITCGKDKKSRPTIEIAVGGQQMIEECGK
jgi:hypothetical protein